MSKMAMREELALTLLADAVASEVDEGHENPSIPDEALRQEMRSRIMRPQEDIVEMVRDEAARCGLDLEKFLPVELIDKMADAFLKASGGKLTLADLYEHDEQAAHRFVMGALGHGINADDDTDAAEWLTQQGVDLDKMHYLNFDGPHDQAYEFIQAWMAAYPAASEATVEADVGDLSDTAGSEDKKCVICRQPTQHQKTDPEGNSEYVCDDFMCGKQFRQATEPRRIQTSVDIDIERISPVEGSAESDFLAYLEGTLIPDLKESGMEATAEDFESLAAYLKGNDARGWDDMADFVFYLQDTLIPDLKESGNEATAEDFEAGVLLLGEQQSARGAVTAEHKITKPYLEDLLKQNNEKYGTDFTLGGAYGNIELWSKGQDRLEAGSLKDCYEAFVKERFKEKHKAAVQASSSGNTVRAVVISGDKALVVSVSPLELQSLVTSAPSDKLHGDYVAVKAGQGLSAWDSVSHWTPLGKKDSVEKFSFDKLMTLLDGKPNAVQASQQDVVVFVKDLPDLGIKSGDSFEVQDGADPLQLLLYGMDEKQIPITKQKFESLEQQGVVLEASVIHADLTQQNREEFAGFCRNASDAQLPNILEKEMKYADTDSDRAEYADICRTEMEGRGIPVEASVEKDKEMAKVEAAAEVQHLAAHIGHKVQLLKMQNGEEFRLYCDSCNMPILQEKLPVAPVVATGEPDQDYDHAFFDAIVTELGQHGMGGSHREFDKYQGVYLDVTREGKKLGRFWVSEIETFNGPGGEEASDVEFTPDQTDVAVHVLVMPVGDQYVANVDDLLGYLKLPHGKGNEMDAAVTSAEQKPYAVGDKVQYNGDECTVTKVELAQDVPNPQGFDVYDRIDLKHPNGTVTRTTPGLDPQLAAVTAARNLRKFSAVKGDIDSLFKDLKVLTSEFSDARFELSDLGKAGDSKAQELYDGWTRVVHLHLADALEKVDRD